MEGELYTRFKNNLLLNVVFQSIRETRRQFLEQTNPHLICWAALL